MCNGRTRSIKTGILSSQTIFLNHPSDQIDFPIPQLQALTPTAYPNPSPFAQKMATTGAPVGVSPSDVRSTTVRTTYTTTIDVPYAQLQKLVAEAVGAKDRAYCAFHPTSSHLTLSFIDDETVISLPMFTHTHSLSSLAVSPFHHISPFRNEYKYKYLRPLPKKNLNTIHPTNLATNPYPKSPFILRPVLPLPCWVCCPGRGRCDHHGRQRGERQLPGRHLRGTLRDQPRCRRGP